MAVRSQDRMLAAPAVDVRTRGALRGGPDVAFVCVTAALLAIGIVMVFSASSVIALQAHDDPYYYLKRQAVSLTIALALGFVAYTVDYRRLRRWVPGFALACVAALVVVWMPHVGLRAGGSHRWVGAGPLSFQPSEFAKLALIAYLAVALERRGERVRTLSTGLVPIGLFAATIVVLVLLEPDVGTATILAITAFAMIFIAGTRLRHLAVVLLATGPFGIAFALSRHGERLTAFLHPFRNASNSGYHIVQSLYALGDGGIFGVGLGLSVAKYGYLPEAYNDFIGAVIGEELGFVGLITVIALFVTFTLRALAIARRSGDRFGFFLAFGCGVSIGIQALLNIGVISSSWPVTGVPLPFISFGGTSLIVCVVMSALVANVGMRSRPSVE